MTRLLLISLIALLSYDPFYEGMTHFNLSNYQEAIEYFKEVITKEPDNDAAYYYMGLSYSALSEYELAESYLGKAVEKDPTNYWYRTRLAQFYTHIQRPEAALQMYEEIIKDYPSKISVFYEMINLYNSTDQADKAIETLDKIEALRGANEFTENARYELLNAQGKYEEADKYLLKLEKEYPSPQNSYLVGNYYKDRYNDTTAIAYFNKALSIDSTFALAFLGLSEVYRMNREFNLYFKNVNLFLASDYIASNLKNDYLREIVQIPQFLKAFLPNIDTLFTTTLSAHPKDTAINSLAGSYYFQTNRFEEGLRLLKENTILYPDDWKQNIHYISYLYALKEWEKIIEQLNNTMHLFPNDISIVELLASSNWQCGKFDEAIVQYNNIIKQTEKHDPYRLSAYAALGDIYHSLNNHRKAFSYYEKALAIDPDYAPVLNNYAYFLSLKNQSLKKALEMSKKSLKSEPDSPTYLDTYGWILYLLDMPEEAKIQFKRAMLFGGKESAVMLDHYAEVLFKLQEYDLAFIYWDKAKEIDPSLGINEKISERKSQIKR